MRDIKNVTLTFDGIEIPDDQRIPIILMKRGEKSGVRRKLHILDLRLHFDREYLGDVLEFILFDEFNGPDD